MPITIYTTPGCGACVAVKSAMRRASLTYTEVDLNADLAALRFVKDRLGHTRAPVIVQTDPRTGAVTSHWSGMAPSASATPPPPNASPRQGRHEPAVPTGPTATPPWSATPTTSRIRPPRGWCSSRARRTRPALDSDAQAFQSGMSAPADTVSA